MRGQRRLGAHLAAFSFDAFQQRGFLAADIGAGADAHFDFEGMTGVGDAGAEQAAAARIAMRLPACSRSHSDIRSGI